MYLYYTVSSAPQADQSIPSLSLGGFKSSSKVQNAQFNNLFGDITPTTINSFNQNRYVALVLNNELTTEATNVKIWFDYPIGTYSLFRVAAVELALNASGQLQMEHVDSIYSKPLAATFYEANGEDNAVSIGDIAVGEQIGIWIEMELLMEFIESDQLNISEPDPSHQNRYKPIAKAKFDDIKINFKWD